MFQLIEKYEVVRWMLKCDYICYSAADVCKIYTPNSQVYINIASEYFLFLF